jgi:hypothetical protein
MLPETDAQCMHSIAHPAEKERDRGTAVFRDSSQRSRTPTTATDIIGITSNKTNMGVPVIVVPASSKYFHGPAFRGHAVSFLQQHLASTRTGTWPYYTSITSSIRMLGLLTKYEACVITEPCAFSIKTIFSGRLSMAVEP